MGKFLSSLLSANSADVCSVAFTGLIAILFLCGLATYSSLTGKPFDAEHFGYAAAGIVLAIGGGKGLRDGWRKDANVPN